MDFWSCLVTKNTPKCPLLMLLITLTCFQNEVQEPLWDLHKWIFCLREMFAEMVLLILSVFLSRKVLYELYLPRDHIGVARAVLEYDFNDVLNLTLCDQRTLLIGQSPALKCNIYISF